jgi:hypothetical protein
MWGLLFLAFNIVQHRSVRQFFWYMDESGWGKTEKSGLSGYIGVLLGNMTK